MFIIVISTLSGINIIPKAAGKGRVKAISIIGTTRITRNI
jgi:hypothetical protein